MPSLSSRLKAGLAAASIAATAIGVASCQQLCGPRCGGKKEQLKNGCGAAKGGCGAAKGGCGAAKGGCGAAKGGCGASSN